MKDNFIEFTTSSIDSLLSASSKTKSNINADIRKELLSKSVDHTMITKIYKDILRTLIAQFSTLVCIDDQENLKKIPCWHGNAERVIAKLKQESNVVLPVLSIYRNVDVTQSSRRRADHLITYSKYFDKVKNRAVRVASIVPTPVDINYRLNVWAKYQEDIDQLSEQVRRHFNPQLLVQTKHNTQTVAFLSQESSNVDVTNPDGQDRIIRRNFDIVVEAYIPNPKFVITHTGKIETFNAEIHLPL